MAGLCLTSSFVKIDHQIAYKCFFVRKIVESQTDWIKKLTKPNCYLSTYSWWKWHSGWCSDIHCASEIGENATRYKWGLLHISQCWTTSITTAIHCQEIVNKYIRVFVNEGKFNWNCVDGWIKARTCVCVQTKEEWIQMASARRNRLKNLESWRERPKCQTRFCLLHDGKTPNGERTLQLE